MRYRVNPDLKLDLNRFGVKEDWQDCFHCGNCTAVCSLTEENILFPRRIIRNVQLGFKNKLVTDVDPWLCYYCGECSETCPREANPGELMMSFRRWLTIKYDWTGIARLFYKSLPAFLIAMIVVAIGIIVIGITKDFKAEAMMEFGHKFEKYVIYAVACLILLPNLLRMFWFVILKNKLKVPVFAYISNSLSLFVNLFTQKNYLKCEGDTFRWVEHLLIVIGYLGLLVITVFFNWFNTDSETVKWIGYIVGALVFIFTFDFVLKRSSKKRESSKFSHPSDWMFVVWLFLLGLTAFITRILVDAGAIENNLWVYFIHLIVIAQWGLLIVPFGKWTHFLYRAFAIYFSNLKQAALMK
ncbi:MAG: 4Fe-4S dicluster domain-containing protein [Bacteroidetes bacterium]|nr:4Fe-4S dicluster domain-containing protein [Bacteroidota bacterium]MBL6962954.1 4Fe-4S dicluster domain-containing protein [Bacteroidota bacterium]